MGTLLGILSICQCLKTNEERDLLANLSRALLQYQFQCVRHWLTHPKRKCIMVAQQLYCRCQLKLLKGSKESYQDPSISRSFHCTATSGSALQFGMDYAGPTQLQPWSPMLWSTNHFLAVSATWLMLEIP